MKKLILFVVFILILTAAIPVFAQGKADAATDLGSLPQQGHDGDDIPSPLSSEKRALRAQAQEMVATGKAEADGTVVQVANGQFVELAREDEDLIWTLLGEFGPNDSPVGILVSGVPGPLHNEIPQPDRSVNNTTIWAADFSQPYFQDLLFSNAPGAISMTTYYEEQSSGRYSVDGDVTDWVAVPYNTAHYGRNWCGGIVCSTTWWFVRDSVDGWYNNMLASGMSATEIDDYLSQFDVWDRYDQDGDGNFDEPDGYIDHFQNVHAGEGEEAGGGTFGSDAIWSHRWYVQLVPIGAGGPTLDDGSVVPFGGTPVGGSKYWIGDYTIEPENGGVGVFVHEFGHDLDLPDLYDTSGNTGGAENSTGFWTLMSSGSWTSDGTVDIGSKPTHMGAWEKFQLGWLNYEVASAGEKSEHKLGPASTNTKQAQGLFVVLPDKVVTETIADPYSGDYFYYSGAGDDVDNMMSNSYTLDPGSTLSAKANLQIETDWDYAYFIVSTDGGASWQNVETNLSAAGDPNGQNFGFGITGNSGGWVDLTADLSAYSGSVMLGFRYWTDGAVVEPGFMVDDIQITNHPLDDAESDFGWTFDGFRLTTGSETGSYFNAYVAEFRNYRGYDDALRTGPYNFGFQDDPALGNWVERFSYQDGLLISYWDTSEADNSVGAHPGSGLILPIDAHPEVMYRADGGVWRNRIQSYDSTFNKKGRTDALTLHFNSQPSFHPSQPNVAIFDDNIQYWQSENPTGGVINPHTGTQIRIKSVSARGNFMQVEVRPSK